MVWWMLVVLLLFCVVLRCFALLFVVMRCYALICVDMRCYALLCVVICRCILQYLLAEFWICIRSCRYIGSFFGMKY